MVRRAECEILRRNCISNLEHLFLPPYFFWSNQKWECRLLWTQRVINEAPIAAPSQERKQKKEDKRKQWLKKYQIYLSKSLCCPYVSGTVLWMSASYWDHAVLPIVKAHRNENSYLKYSEYLRQRVFGRKAGV